MIRIITIIVIVIRVTIIVIIVILIRNNQNDYMGGFPKVGVAFFGGGPHSEDYRILGGTSCTPVETCASGPYGVL